MTQCSVSKKPTKEWLFWYEYFYWYQVLAYRSNMHWLIIKEFLPCIKVRYHHLKQLHYYCKIQFTYNQYVKSDHFWFISFIFISRFSEQITEQRTEMVSSSSSYTETSTQLGIGFSHPKTPRGIVRDNIILNQYYLEKLCLVTNS